jgi:hypothetical protein
VPVRPQPDHSTKSPATGPSDRYPRRRTRPLLILVVGVVAAVGIGWLLWTAAVHSQPPVSGEVRLWEVVSDDEVSFTLTVDRRDPSQPVSCRVTAQAPNHETVGDKTVEVGPADSRLVDVQDTVRTLRRATTVSLDRCWTD